MQLWTNPRLDRCSFDEKPLCVIWECVAALGFNKSFEKGTETVQQAMEEKGFLTSFQFLNSLDYGLPQSRCRSYGISIKLTEGLGPGGRARRSALLTSTWELVHQLQLNYHEPLDSLWKKFGTVAQENPIKPKGRAQKKQNPRHLKENCKWPQTHQQYLKREGLAETLTLRQVQWARDCFQKASQSERDVDAMHLAFAKLRKEFGQDSNPNIWLHFFVVRLVFLQLFKVVLFLNLIK